MRLTVDGSHLIAWSHPDLVTNAIQCVLRAAADPGPRPITDEAPQPCRDTLELT
jgi:hypothetical protein